MNFSNTHKPSSTVNLNFTNKFTGIFPKLSLATLFCVFFYITSRCEFWILMSTLKSVHKCKAKQFVNDIIISFIVGILTTNAFLYHLWIMYKKNVTQLHSYLYVTALQKKNVLIRNIYHYIKNFRVSGLKNEYRRLIIFRIIYKKTITLKLNNENK